MFAHINDEFSLLNYKFHKGETVFSERPLLAGCRRSPNGKLPQCRIQCDALGLLVYGHKVIDFKWPQLFRPVQPLPAWFRCVSLVMR
jgi:hypothetical protein